ncbi:MAG: hypothetical protein SVX43_10325 [Cyanobacteriota bacterium]|nr:hypothetical protein [Cyanobacteriota bacterium]
MKSKTLNEQVREFCAVLIQNVDGVSRSDREALEERDRAPTDWVYGMLEDEDNDWGEMLYETEALPGARLVELTHIAYRAFYQRREWRDRFTATTPLEIRSSARAVVERWCKDRFQLSSDEAECATAIKTGV